MKQLWQARGIERVITPVDKMSVMPDAEKCAALADMCC